MTNLGIDSLFDTILVVGPNGPERQEICASLGTFGCKIRFADNQDQAFKIVQTMPQIDVVLFNLASGVEVSTCFEFVRHVRKMDEQWPAIFMVCDGVEGYFNNAYFEGINGIFVRPLDLGELTKAIAIAYSELLGHKDRKHERRQLRRMEISYLVGTQEAKGFGTDISLGGLFIGTMGLMPFEKQAIQIKMPIKPGVELTGTAVVKWLRQQIEFGRPRGFGVQFTKVDEAVLASLLKRE